MTITLIYFELILPGNGGGGVPVGHTGAVKNSATLIRKIIFFSVVKPCKMDKVLCKR